MCPAARLDPVQRLFLQKIREYQTLSQSAEGVPEAGSDDNEFQRRLAEEEAKLQRLYGGCDLTKFPDFNFPEPRLDEDSTK
ncbi:ATP synthase-coupling factor 6, mitochondrial-like [Alosa alosa]|uniref:ATP synthase-coupling factor 6, mitochondrial-like n=1 Tax=Alosa alosa TaxID=278164 RepID=UPI0020153D8A|nr:ATP synthase-coupling factor 6, mitochondrial-like [Alosa alosa]